MQYSRSLWNCKIFSFHTGTSKSQCLYVTGCFPFKKRKSKLDCKIICSNSTQAKNPNNLLTNILKKILWLDRSRQLSSLCLVVCIRKGGPEPWMDTGNSRRFQHLFDANFIFVFSSDYISYLQWQQQKIKRQKNKQCNTCIRTAVCVSCNSRKLLQWVFHAFSYLLSFWCISPGYIFQWN